MVRNGSAERFWEHRSRAWSRPLRPRNGSHAEQKSPVNHSRIKPSASARSRPTSITRLPENADRSPSGFTAGP